MLTKRIYKKRNTKHRTKRRDTKHRHTKRRNTKRTLRGGTPTKEEELMELIRKRSIGDTTITNDALIHLLKQVKNDDKLYDAIFNINKKLISLEEKEAFKNIALNLQEDAYYSVKEFPLCEYGPRCKRQNILHKLSHKFHHPGTFIAEAINKLNHINFI
jgi:hypothetical protein